MNALSLQPYLHNGLDPLAEPLVNSPYMSTLLNWVPGLYGIKRATKITGSALESDLTGLATARFGTVRTYATSSTKVTVGSTTYTYSVGHKLCCCVHGMVFFAAPHSSFAPGEPYSDLYTPSAKTLYWCGGFNEGLGAALGSESNFQGSSLGALMLPKVPQASKPAMYIDSDTGVLYESPPGGPWVASDYVMVGLGNSLPEPPAEEGDASIYYLTPTGLLYAAEPGGEWVVSTYEFYGLQTDPDPPAATPEQLSAPNLDHIVDLTCGYKEFGSAITGLHVMPGGRLVVCTADGLYLVSIADFERFTFGCEQLTSDVVSIPMSIVSGAPLLVNTGGEVLLIASDGIKKLGYSQHLTDKTIPRITYQSYRDEYYICATDATYVIGQTGMWKLGQIVQGVTDTLKSATDITLATSDAITAPFDLQTEGIKNLKGVRVVHTGTIYVSVGTRKSANEEFVYTTPEMPDSRGAVNVVASGSEFTIRITASGDATVSDLGVFWTDAVKTNVSRHIRRF